jgi:predicted PurR-regulated permease PerM
VTPEPAAFPAPVPADRRRADRRDAGRVADLPLPELRRLAITTLLGATVLGLFLWMVRSVIIAAVLAAVIATYLRPAYVRAHRVLGGRASAAAVVTLLAVTLPIAAALVYSYVEIVQAAQYLSAHDEEVARHIIDAMRRFLGLGDASTEESVRRSVVAAAGWGAAAPALVRRAVLRLSVGTTIFLFTAAYVFTEGPRVGEYVRARIPARYAELAGALETNGRGVFYGAIYATLVTQALKSLVILAMNTAFGVPLAVPLAVLSFIIGFFPIVGSWTVYVPVAAWLLIFRDAPGQAIVMIVVGTVFNTVFISMYVRPTLAAAKSRVLNFYWMFVGLVTGVYAFGLAGVLLGPLLIGLLKAVLDTVTTPASWRLIETDELAAPSAGGAA